jgi:hypothetical protein
MCSRKLSIAREVAGLFAGENTPRVYCLTGVTEVTKIIVAIEICV